MWWDTILTIIRWSEILNTGFDAVIYFFMGVIGLGLMILRLGLMMLGLDDAGEIDFGGEVDLDVSESASSFGLFSLLSILAFFAGVGWTGLAARMSWELSPGISLIVAFSGGVALMLLAATGMFLLRKLEHEVKYDTKTAIGHTGTVYLKIPGNGEGTGQVEITVSGRRKVMTAKTKGDEIASFKAVRVVEVLDDETLIVEKS